MSLARLGWQLFPAVPACLMASLLAGAAWAQNSAKYWFQDPEGVKFYSLSPDVQKCIQTQEQSQNYRQLFLCTSRLSEAGDRSADVLTGELYWMGLGTSQNHKAAADLWEKSYNSGFASAAIFFAAPFTYGLGRPKDLEKAKSLRKEGALKTKQSLNATQISGYIGPQDYPQECAFLVFGCKMVGETIVAEISIDPLGSVSECTAVGDDPTLKEATCAIITKRFKYLPALSAEGTAVSYKMRQNIRWNPPPSRPDLSAPAKIVTGSINATMVPSSIANTLAGNYDLRLALSVSAAGTISGCKTSGGPIQLNKWACQVASSQFKFEPARNKGGRIIPSTATLNYTLSFGSEAKDTDTTAKPVTVPNATAAQRTFEEPTNTVDQNLETAIGRCKRIGFKENEPGYRECVLEQIRILSK